MKKLFSVTKLAASLFGVRGLNLKRREKTLHGHKLLELTDEQLFETVYLQNVDLVYSYPDEDTAFQQIKSEYRIVFTVSVFDMEIQNGGLCQFFVNSPETLASHVNEYLKIVGAEEHQKLFADFVRENHIDLNNLQSFRISDIEEFSQQSERYDFEVFDKAYSELPPLTYYITKYIKANISTFQ